MTTSTLTDERCTPLSSHERRELISLLFLLPLLVGLTSALLRLVPADPHLWLQGVAGVAVMVLVGSLLFGSSLAIGIVVGALEARSLLRAGATREEARALWARVALVSVTLPVVLVQALRSR